MENIEPSVSGLLVQTNRELAGTIQQGFNQLAQQINVGEVTIRQFDGKGRKSFKL